MDTMHPALRAHAGLAALRARPSQVGALSETETKVWYYASIASMAASAYHGYRRNNSLGWGLGWGLAGAVFPVITPTIAVAQGFGQPRGA